MFDEVAPPTRRISAFGCRSSVASIAMWSGAWQGVRPRRATRHRLCDGSSLTYQPPTARFSTIRSYAYDLLRLVPLFSAPLTSKWRQATRREGPRFRSVVFEGATKSPA